MAAMGGDPADDMMGDVGMDDDEGDDDMGDEGDVEDRVEDLEDALEDLKAEFEKLMAGDEGEPEMGDDEMDMGDEEGDDEMDMDDEDAPEKEAAAAPAAPRTTVSSKRKLTAKESAAVEATTADDSKALVGRGAGGGRGKAPVKLYANGTRVIHKDHGPGQVYGQDAKTGKLAIRLDKDPDTVMDDVSHTHVTQEGSGPVAIPSRNTRANQPIKETAEPAEGPLNLKNDSTSPLDKLIGK
jgi:hypothetical protein